MWLPDTGTHGPLDAIQRECGYNSTRGSTAVRTRDGAILGARVLPFYGEDSAQWTMLVTPEEPRGDALAVFAGHACAATSRGLECRWIPRSPADRERVSDVFTLDVADVAALVTTPSAVCALDRGGRVRCARWVLGDRFEPYTPEGLPARVDALAGGVGGPCARGVDRRWRCAVPSSRDALTRLGDPPPHAEPLLDGAVEVALNEDGGCARWSDGAARCWGRFLRGEAYVRRGPTLIRGVDGASAVVAQGPSFCALQRGEVWCWGFVPTTDPARGSPRPTRVAFPGPVRALAPGYAAIGGEVFAWDHGDLERLPNPPGPRAAISSLHVLEEFVCARRVGGGATCWRERWTGSDDVGTRRVFVFDRSTEALRAARDADASRPLRVEGRCVVDRSGRRRCDLPTWIPGIPRIATPSWALDPESDEARMLRSTYAPCAILPDGRVGCLQYRPDTEVLRGGDRRARLGFWGILPGVDRATSLALDRGDVRAGYIAGCALRADGRVLCWGENYAGSLTADEVDRAPSMVPLRW